MIAVTLQEAKARLNRLVEMALSGEEVVLIRGSEIVAMIRPLSASEVEVSPKLTDLQAKHFWEEVEGEKKKSFQSPRASVKALKRLP